MRLRNREINRRQARRLKTRRLKARLQTTGDNKLKARLTEKLKRINTFLPDVK